MPKAGTYRRTPKAKVAWTIREKPDGFQVFNFTTAIPLMGYWKTYEIAEKQGRAFFGCDPVAATGQEVQSRTVAQAAETGDGTNPRQPVPIVDVSSPSPGPQPTQQAVDVPQGEVPVEGSTPPMPPVVVRPTLTPQEARELICKVFRAHVVTRPKQR